MERPLVIGTWPLPLTDEIIAFLKPAADLGGVEIEQGPGWTVWTVHDGAQLIGAANVRRTVAREVEVVLVGGREFRRWIGLLDSMLGDWARCEGATCMRAGGRRGWAPILTQLGWKATPTMNGMTEYERALTLREVCHR